MIQTIARWFFLILSGAILVVGLFPSLQRWLDQHDLIPDQYSHGDLYNLTNLPAFREEDFDANAALRDADKPKQQYRNVHLYTIGDSFTDIDTGLLCRRTKCSRMGRKPAPNGSSAGHHQKKYYGDRVYRTRLTGTCCTRPISGKSILKKVLSGYRSKAPIVVKWLRKKSRKGWLFARFGEEINQRLEFILFNSKLFIWFKELKANIMLYWFGRVTGGVISEGQKTPVLHRRSR